MRKDIDNCRAAAGVARTMICRAAIMPMQRIWIDAPPRIVPSTNCIGTLFALVSLLLTNTASGDGGTLRRVESVDGYSIAVFTSPSPLVVGLADVSVLIQDNATRQYVLDGRLLVHVANVEQPSARRSATATTELATNKLFRAAHIEFDRPGRWRVTVECHAPRGRTSVAFDVEVEPPRPPWLAMWPWLTWPFAVVALFIFYEATRHRRHRSTSAKEHAAAG